MFSVYAADFIATNLILTLQVSYLMSCLLLLWSYQEICPSPRRYEGKVKLSLCYMKHHYMKYHLLN